MAVRLDEQELSNLDKQTLIKMYLGLQDSVEKLSQSIDILTAVSYTHLDVYKRQVL